MTPLKSVKDGGSNDEEQGKLIFGRYIDAEMLAKLKVLALDPCDPNVSRQEIQPLWKQILQVLDVMTLSDNDIYWGMLVLTLTAAGSKLHPPECENQESAPCIGPPEVAVLVHLKLQPH